ncbi:tetratricopeptide repeat protein, partial [Salinispira pacifica]
MLAAILLLSTVPLWAKSLLEQGEDLFLQNKPREAAALFENALLDEPNNDRIYLYLGICYEQLGQYDRAVSILTRGLNVPGADRSVFYYDLGNNYLAKKENDKAEEMYSKAIDINSSFASPYLNRANVRVQAKKYDAAIDDYVTYLGLKPNDPQQGSIEKMISLLKGEVQAEQKRIAEQKQKQ